MGSTAGPVVGENFAWNLMKSQGWSSGDGLGKNRQGRRDAIKPRLKFDGHGLGHDRSEEFEFHWWDHLFNTAAKGVTVNDPAENGGEITVSFQADKSERSAKKLRRKMQKEMKNRLYSRFVRAGTLKGEKLAEEESSEQDVVTEVKDTGKIKTMSDEDLIKACGGRTAHKGARHGQKMSAKLQRIQDAEAEFVKIMLQQQADKLKKKEKKSELKEVPTTNKTIVNHEQNEQPVKKKKKDKKEKVFVDADSASNESIVGDNSEEPVSKKRKKCKKDKVQEDMIDKVDETEAVLETTDESIKKKKKKHKKQKDHDEISPEAEQNNEEILQKKKKSKKKSKESCETCFGKQCQQPEICQGLNFEL